MKRVVKENFLLNFGDLKSANATVHADLDGPYIKIVSVVAPFQAVNGQTIYLDVAKMLTLPAHKDAIEFMRGADGASDAVLDWDFPEGAA